MPDRLRMAMALHLPTLTLLSIALLVVASSVMTLFGTTARVYRGYWCWVAAQWLSAAGLALQVALPADRSWQPLAALLVLQWPVMVLAGMRRFYPRHGWPLPIGVDLLLAAGSYVAWLAAWAAPLPADRLAQLGSAATVLLHLYAGALVVGLREFRRSAALKTLLGVEVATAAIALTQVIDPQHLLGGLVPASEPLVGQVLATTTASLVMVYLGLLLSCERTEGNLRTTQRKLRFLADTDPLTKVPNRRRFHELAAKTLAEVDHAAATAMMFDIDHFKQINDRFGHPMGDKALKLVARCTRESLRDADVLGRLGGDEFGVLLPATSLNEAMTVASRIVDRLRERMGEAPTVDLRLSFGVVQVLHGEGIADALRRADQALYEAKRQGRSRAVVAAGDEDRPLFGESRPLGLTPM